MGAAHSCYEHTGPDPTHRLPDFFRGLFGTAVPTIRPRDGFGAQCARHPGFRRESMGPVDNRPSHCAAGTRISRAARHARSGARWEFAIITGISVNSGHDRLRCVPVARPQRPRCCYGGSSLGSICVTSSGRMSECIEVHKGRPVLERRRATSVTITGPTLVSGTVVPTYTDRRPI